MDDIIEDAEIRAEVVAFSDRMRYEKFIIAAEHFASENGLIVAGSAATRLLLGHSDDNNAPPEIGLDSFHIEFFSGQALTHARALADVMYKIDPDGLGHYTSVVTKVANYILLVSVDGRNLFTITSLQTNRGVRMSDVVIPSDRPAQFARDIYGKPIRLQCLGPEIQLIDIYATLCNPAKVSCWGNLIITEASIRALFNEEIKNKIDTAVTRTGGVHSQHHLYQILRDKYAAGPGRVVIGPVAIALLVGKKSEDRLQVITANKLDSDAQEITMIAKTAGIEITWKTDDLKIPTDIRLHRMTVYVVVKGHREPILDVFNSASFDLVPYTTKTIDSKLTLKIGTPFVLMRYRLIDMWTVQVLIQMGAINIGFAKTVLNAMLYGYNTVVNHYESILTSAHNDPKAAAHQLIPIMSYIGRLEDPELALKRASRVGLRFYPKYFPANHIDKSM